MKKIDLISTIKGSDIEGAYPKQWDLEKMQSLIGDSWEDALERQSFWHEDFEVIPADWFEEVQIKWGHEMAKVIKQARDNGQKIGMIFPIGPVGQYRWAAYFLNQWKVKCDHLYGFNMDDWSDAEGNVENVFDQAMEALFYGPLGENTVPVNQRNYATKENLPTYAGKMAKIKEDGGIIVLTYSVGWPQHISFNDPHWAAEYNTMEEYLKEDYRIAGTLDWMTLEENAGLAFKSNLTAMPAHGNSLSTGIMIRADYTIGGILAQYPGTTHTWQGMCLWTTLRYGPDIWMPDSVLPTKPGKLFFVKELADIKGPFKLRVD